MTAHSQHAFHSQDSASRTTAAAAIDSAAPPRAMDDRMRFLDALFCEAEALVHGPDGQRLNRNQNARLDVLMAEIDQMMGELETQSRPLGPSSLMDWDDIDEKPLFAFEELTYAEEVSTAGLAALEAFDPLHLARREGPLALDVETALDRITAQLDLGMAMDIPPSELLAPLNLQPLSPADAARIDAVFSCMDHILETHRESLLSPAAQEDLERLMREADRILGLDLPDAVNAPRGRDSWRRAVSSIGEAMGRLMPGHRSPGSPLPA